MPNNNYNSKDEELKSLKEDLKNYRKFMKFAAKNRDDALLNGDKESYELWDDDYFYNMSQVRNIKERIKALEGAK